MIYRKRLRARIIEITSRVIVVRVQVAHHRQRMPGYEFGMAWRNISDANNPGLGIRIALRRAIAANSFDPDHPDLRLLTRTAIRGLLRYPNREARLTLIGSSKDL